MIIADIVDQIENYSNEIINLNDDINDLKAVKEILESKVIYNTSIN